MLNFFAQHKLKQHNIQYHLDDFIFRHKRLTKLLVKEGIDALLLITGYQSNHNISNTQLANWLFKGVSGFQLKQLEQLDQGYLLLIRLQEMILLLKKEKSYLFLSPEGFQQIRKMICFLPNIDLFVPTKEEYEDKQQLDILKMGFFYRVMSNIKKVGMIISPNQEIKSIEKWPIIKLYALEQFNRGFFSLHHQPLDVTSKIFHLYKNHDRYSINYLYNVTAQMLKGHVKGALEALETIPMKKRGQISEQKIVQPLKIVIQILEKTEQSSKYPMARVLLGSRTLLSQKSSSATIEDLKAQHFTLQYCDPYSGLLVCRTYFTNCCVNIERGVKTEFRQEQQTLIINTVYKLCEYQKPNNQHLIIYIQLIQAMHSLLTASSKSIKSFNQKHFHQTIQKQLSKFKTVKRVQVNINCINAWGQPTKVDWKDPYFGRIAGVVWVIRAQVEVEGLGKILVADSAIVQQGFFVILTKSIPYLYFLNCDNTYSMTIQQMKVNIVLEQLGQCQSQQLYNNSFFIPTKNLSNYQLDIPRIKCSYWFHKKGLRIYSDMLGWQILLFKETFLLTLVQVDKRKMMISQVQYPFIGSWDIVVFEFNGDAFKQLIHKLYQKQFPVPFKYLEQFPFSLKCPHISQLSQMQINNHLINKEIFLAYLNHKQLMMINNQKEYKLSAFKQLSEKHSQNHIHIVGIVGIADGKVKLAQCLADCAKEFDYSQTSIIEVQQQLQVQGLRQDPSHLHILCIGQNVSICQLSKNPKLNILNIVCLLDQKYIFLNRNKSILANVFKHCLWGYSQFIIPGNFQNDFSTDRNLNGGEVVSKDVAQVIIRRSKFNHQQQKLYRIYYSILYQTNVNQSPAIKLVPYNIPLTNIRIRKHLHEQIMVKQNGYLYNPKIITEQLKSDKLEAQKSNDHLALLLFRIKEYIMKLNLQTNSSKIESIKLINRQEEFINQGVFETVVNGAGVWDKPSKKTKIVQGKVVGEQLGAQVRGYLIEQNQIISLLQSLTIKVIIDKQRQIFSKMQQQLSMQSITQQILEKLDKQNINNLSENYFFDGKFYRDYDSIILKHHPQIEQLKKQYLELQNARVKQHNLSILKEWQLYKQKFLN